MRLAPISLFLVFSVCSCLPQARTNQLVPVVRSSTQTGQAVSVSTTGGNDQSIREGLGVKSNEFRSGLEQSLIESGLFSQIGGGGYQLDTRILNINHPAESAVFNVTTQIEVDYTLSRAGSTVWKKSIRSSHRTESGEALLGEFRDRMAAEGAIRENIKIAISSMSEALR